MPEVPASPPDLSPSRCSILQVKDSLFPSTFVTGEYRAIAYIGDEISFGRELECEMSFGRELECEMSFGRELACEAFRKFNGEYPRKKSNFTKNLL